MDSKLRQRLFNLGRIVISVVLLAWVVRGAGLAELLRAARAADWRLYGLAGLLALAGIVIRALRWQVLLNAVGPRVPFGRTLYLYFVGAFFNTFLPTGFGGDVIRVLEIGPGATSQQAAGTALVDRLTGFIVLFALALVALPFGYRLLPPGTAGVIALVAAGVLAAGALLLQGRLLRWLTGWLPRSLSLAGDAWIGKTYAVITACGRRGVGLALLFSLWFNLQLMVESVLVARALGIEVSPWVFFMFVPITTAALLVPISISGFGVREGLYVTLFGQLGVDPARAVALSLATYSLDILTGLVGGVIYFGAGLLGLRAAAVSETRETG
jgi:glycosyltransferase 2 family protein